MAKVGIERKPNAVEQAAATVTRHSWRNYRGDVERCARRGCRRFRKGNPGDYKYRVTGEEWARGWPTCTGQPTTDR